MGRYIMSFSISLECPTLDPFAAAQSNTVVHLRLAFENRVAFYRFSVHVWLISDYNPVKKTSPESSLKARSIFVKIVVGFCSFLICFWMFFVNLLVAYFFDLCARWVSRRVLSRQLVVI